MPRTQDRIFLTLLIASLALLSAVSVNNMAVAPTEPAASPAPVIDAGAVARTEELKAKLAAYGLPLHPAEHWRPVSP